MSHQDFKEIILRNPSAQKKLSSSSNKPNVVISKIEKQLLNDDEMPTIKYFGKDNGKTLQNARISKGWTQEMLANNINERKGVINSYEVGNIVPDQKVLSKLRRVLNIKFN